MPICVKMLKIGADNRSIPNLNSIRLGIDRLNEQSAELNKMTGISIGIDDNLSHRPNISNHGQLQKNNEFIPSGGNLVAETFVQ